MLLISPSNSGLTEEQRKSLLKKVTKLVTFTNKYNPVNQIFRRYGKREMSYNASKVKEIIHFRKKELQELDDLISKFLVKWTISRLPRMDLAILETAAYEILYVDEVPTSVAINEAVKLSKKYGTPDSSSYVNGVLSSLEKSL